MSGIISLMQKEIDELKNQFENFKSNVKIRLPCIVGQNCSGNVYMFEGRMYYDAPEPCCNVCGANYKITIDHHPDGQGILVFGGYMDLMDDDEY